MLLRKEICFHFFTDLLKNSLGPQSEISVVRWSDLLVEIAMMLAKWHCFDVEIQLSFQC